METDVEDVLHTRFLMPPNSGGEATQKIMALMADEVEARRGPHLSIFLIDHADPYNGAVMAQSTPLAEDDPTWVEVGGGDLRVRRIVEILLEHSGAREVPIAESTPAWEDRDLPPISQSVQLVDLPRSRLEYSPLVQVMAEYAASGGGRPGFRTPDTTVSGPTARLALDDGRFTWVRCTGDGLAEGVTGIGASWVDGELVADGPAMLDRDPDLPGLRVEVLHPYDDPTALGEATAAVLDRLGVASTTCFGLQEPALCPWDAALLRHLSRKNAPDIITWVLTWPTGGGVLHVMPGRRGVVEELHVLGDAFADLTDEAAWDAVHAFAPTRVARTHGSVMVRGWAHQSLASRLWKGRAVTHEAPAGYVSLPRST